MSEQAQKSTPATPTTLRADYVNQLNNANAQLSALEGEKARLTAYREQLKGAIYALDQVLTAQAQAAAEAAEASKAKASEETETKAAEATETTSEEAAAPVAEAASS